MTKAIIWYKDGTTHKLCFNGYSYAKMQKLVVSNLAGYPDKELFHYTMWIER